MKNQYLRVRKEKDHLVLEAAVKTYHKNGLEVKLAGMDHVANKDFFKKMFSALDSLEIILYEGTGKGKISKSQKKSDSYKLDKSYKKGIVEYAHAHGWHYQNEIIPHNDYGKHWKHCDIGLAEEMGKMEKSEEDLKSLIEETIKMKCFSEKAKTGFDKREESLYVHARLFKRKSEEDKSEIIIKYRNSLVIDELKRLINEERAKKIGVMYGADHMPGISSFLEKEGFNLKSEEWVKAWRVKDLNKNYKWVKAWLKDLKNNYLIKY